MRGIVVRGASAAAAAQNERQTTASRASRSGGDPTTTRADNGKQQQWHCSSKQLPLTKKAAETSGDTHTFPTLKAPNSLAAKPPLPEHLYHRAQNVEPEPSANVNMNVDAFPDVSADHTCLSAFPSHEAGPFIPHQIFEASVTHQSPSNTSFLNSFFNQFQNQPGPSIIDTIAMEIDWNHQVICLHNRANGPP